MRPLHYIIKRPLLTEKVTAKADTAKVVAFEVARDANKIEIKQALEKAFDITVKACRPSVREKGQLEKGLCHFDRR